MGKKNTNQMIRVLLNIEKVFINHKSPIQHLYKRCKLV